MRVLISAVMATLALGVPLVGVAETVKYKCEFRQMASKVYLAPTSEVTLDLDNWKGSVEDAVEMKALGRPVHVTVNSQSDKRIGLSWTVDNLPFDMKIYARSRTHKYFYRMNIFENGDATISAESRLVIRDETNIFSAKGNCKKAR